MEMASMLDAYDISHSLISACSIT